MSTTPSESETHSPSPPTEDEQRADEVVAESTDRDVVHWLDDAWARWERLFEGRWDDEAAKESRHMLLLMESDPEGFEAMWAEESDSARSSVDSQRPVLPVSATIENHTSSPAAIVHQESLDALSRLTLLQSPLTGDATSRNETPSPPVTSAAQSAGGSASGVPSEDLQESLFDHRGWRATSAVRNSAQQRVQQLLEQAERDLTEQGRSGRDPMLVTSFGDLQRLQDRRSDHHSGEPMSEPHSKHERQ